MLLRLRRKQADMSRRGLVLDGLWYSLCPSFTPRALNRPSPLLQTRKRSSRSFAPVITCMAGSLSRRNYADNSNDRHNIVDSDPPFSSDVSSANDIAENESPTKTEPLSTNDLEHYPSTSDMLDERREKELQHLYKIAMANPTTPGVYESLPTSFLERKLQEDMARKPNIRDAERFFRVLIRDRQIIPTARHYKALILANCDNEAGSSSAVRRLLDEMNLNNIAMDSGTLHAALQVNTSLKYCLSKYDSLIFDPGILGYGSASRLYPSPEST